MKKLIIVLIVLIVLIAATLVAALWYLKRAKPSYADVDAAPVTRDVEVWHDSLAVPHVWAHTTKDLLFAQGYLHAQERLWQMELFRRVGEGRLAEVFGADLIDTDRFLRTLGLWHSAAANEKTLRGEQLDLINAYVAGVNHWIDTQEGALPPEFLALRIKPERWTARHSLAIEKIMSWDLSLYDGAAELTRAAQLLGDKAKYLMPNDPAWGTTIIETPQIPALPKPAAALLDALSITRASNAWVIGGTRTRSGKPILANDMHLALRQPGVWYLMALHAPGIDVAGMTLPGVPYVIAGHSKAVAWGFTNVMMDDVDFFIERVDAADSARYITANGARAFEYRNEEIRVKGRDEPIRFRVRSTIHGPVISDVESRMRGSEVIAMRWAALDSARSFVAFDLLNKACSADDVRQALRWFQNPHQNVVYADTAGNFGYQMAGRIPRRGDFKRPPILPVPGWTGEFDWQGFVPFEQHPAVHNPGHGYVVTANNRQAHGRIGDLISNDWDMPFRAARITEMVRSRANHDASSVHGMQMDVKDLLALKYNKHAVAAARAAGLNDVARLLEGWNSHAVRTSRAAPYFYVWYEQLRRELGRTLYGQHAYIPRDALNNALDSARILWLGADGGRKLDSLSIAAIAHAHAHVHGKTWGDVHEVVAVHALGEVAAIEKLLDLNVGPAPHQGAPTTVNVAQYISGTLPIRTSYGPSERHVVDMANVDGAGGFILPTGQSGLPASEHYKDMFERWRSGGLWLIPLDRAAAQARAVHKMTIRPWQASTSR